MKFEKQYVGRIFLGLEIIVFAGFYVFGSNGLRAVRMLQKEIDAVDMQVLQLKQEISQTRASVALQKKHPFFQEQFARKRLEMARPDDEIFVYNT